MGEEPEQLREARTRRKARGILSSIDILVGEHPEVEPDLVWALGELYESRLPQTAILAEFNERLADRGLKPITKSSWSRWAVKKALQFHKLREARALASELTAHLGTDGSDELTILAGETIKLASWQKADGGGHDPKDLNHLSQAVKNSVLAQAASAEHRRKLRKEFQDKLDKAFEAVGEKLADSPPGGHVDHAALLHRIREEVYGIFAEGDDE